MASDETIVGTPDDETRQIPSNVITTFDDDDALEIFRRKDTFTSGLDDGRTTIVADPFDAGNPVLSTAFDAGTRGHVQWQSDLGGPQESATLEYRFMFVDQGDGFDFQRGGKLPGLAGGTAPTGGQPADDGLGFSARFNWIERSISSPDTNLSVYVYDMAGEQDHMRLSYAEPTRSRSQPSPADPDDAIVLENGRWHAIKQQIVMNTPGQADGVLRVWLDDELALEVTDMKMRSSADVGIDMLYFSAFFGGPDTPEWQAAKDELIYYDDFRVTLEDGSIVSFDIDAGAPITSPPSPAGDEAEAGAEAAAEAEDEVGSPAPGTAEAGAGTKSPADADAAGGAAVPDIASDITSDEGTPSVTASSVVDASTPTSDDVAPIVVQPLVRREQDMADSLMTSGGSGSTGMTLFGTTDSETLQGSAGADHINGGYGDDRIQGGAGNDVLDGDRGSDLLEGGDGDDTLIIDSDAGEPVVGQDYDPNDGRNNELDPATNRLYPNQPFVADDVLVGGAGADTFLVKPQINAKEDIILKHTQSDGRIDWADVAGENDNVHDHWVDSIGTNVIADYSKAEGDRIQVYGHTTAPKISYADVDGDGDEESIIKIYSNQANGGAHDDDFLGQVIVHGDRVELDDLEQKSMETYGVVERIDELAEAIAPTGTPDSDIQSTASENPFIGEVETLDPGGRNGNGYTEQSFARPLAVASDDVIDGTADNDVLVGDEMPEASAALNQPISFFSLANPVNGTFPDATGVSSARYYTGDNGEARLQATIDTIPGPDGTAVANFSDAKDTFVYIPNDPAYQVLNASVTAWFNPTEIGGRQTIFAKDESDGDDGGHFFARVESDGRLYIRVAEGDGDNGGTYNHEWISSEPVIVESQWQHVALSLGQAGVAVYLNGELMGDDAFTAVSNGSPAMSEMTQGYLIGNDKPLIIGANTLYSQDTSTAEALGVDNKLTDEFEGGITDVGFWGGDTPSQNLTAAQIADLYANGPGDLSGASAPQPIAVPVGNDTISGAAGDDDIDGGAGNDTLDGGEGSDTAMGGYGNDVVAGGAGADTLDGGHGEDQVSGGDGNDVIISRADAREPEIAQDFDASDDPNGEIDAVSRRLYASQSDLPANDTLTGGAGADEFRFETLINAKLDIINEHVNDDGTIDWMGVAGENDNVHDHWVDGIGDDTITDFNRAEGDRIVIEGHTTEVSSIDVRDVDGDGDLDSVLQLRSNQGAGGGAHNLDLLGTITVLDNEITEDDFTVNAGVAYGIVDTISEYKEAVTPLGLYGESAAPAEPTDTSPPASPESGASSDASSSDDASGTDDASNSPVSESTDETAADEGTETSASGDDGTTTTSSGDDSASSTDDTGGSSSDDSSTTASADSGTASETDTASAPDSGSPDDTSTADDGTTASTTGDGSEPTAGSDDSSTPAPSTPSTSGSLLQALLTPDPDNPASASTSIANDLLLGTSADDDMRGSWGDDRLTGDAGEDDISGGHGDDLMDGGAGSDTLAGDFGDDILIGRAGQDELHGNRGDDVLVGGEDDDILDGGAGDDVLYGNQGEDLLDGGRDFDVAVFDGAIGDYTITALDNALAFTNANGETDLVVDVEHIHFNGTGETYAVQDGQLVAAQDADDVEDLLESDLLAEVLNVSVGATSGTSVEAELAELNELAASQSASDPSALPTQGSTMPAMDAGDLDLGLDTPGEDDLRVA